MTKSSPERRERRLTRKRGRPSGTYASLLRDRHASRSRRGLHLSPPSVRTSLPAWQPADRGEDADQARDIDGLLVMASADYVPPAHADLDDYARALVRKALLVTSRATDRELAWSTASSGALRGLVGSRVTGRGQSKRLKFCGTRAGAKSLSACAAGSMLP